MPIVKCKVCQKPFYAKPNWIKHGWGKFCSSKCHHETLKTGKIVNCFICHKPVYKSGKALKISKSGKYFCNKSCQTIWRNSLVYVGSKHPNWKDGTSTYKKIIERSNKPQSCALCNSADKRILAVHHIDNDRNNNQLHNLIWLCHNCHFLVHHYKNEREKLAAVLK